jgi:hypothetical protein
MSSQLQRLSSNSTLFLKFFIPVFWIVFFGAFTMYRTKKLNHKETKKTKPLKGYLFVNFVTFSLRQTRVVQRESLSLVFQQ